MANSSSHERKEEVYCTPSNHIKLNEYAARTRESKSATINEALRQFFEKQKEPPTKAAPAK